MLSFGEHIHGENAVFSPGAYATWLDNRAGQIFEKVSNQETISNEETLVLVLKAQSDQLHQMAQAIEARFEQIDKRFEQIDRRFEQLSNNFKWGIIAAMGFISLVMALERFFP